MQGGDQQPPAAPENPEASQQPPGPTVHNPDLKPPPAPEPQPQEPAAAQPPAQPHQDQEIEGLSPDQLKQQLKTTQGLLRAEADRNKRITAERDRQGGVISDLTGMVSSLQQQVQDLTARVDAGAAPTDGQAPQPGSAGQGQGTQPQAGTAVDPSNFEGYGDEIQELVRLVNDQAAQLHQFRTQFGEEGQRFEQRVNELGQTVAEQNFYRDLNYDAPDWQAINQRADWRSWLTQPHDRLQAGEVHGWSRDQILQDAYRRGDGRRVAQLVQDFKADMGIAGAASPQGGQPNAQPGGLESEAMPAGSAGSSPSPAGAPQPQGVSKQEFEKAALDRAQGRITEDDFKNILATYTQQARQAAAPPQ